MSMTELYLKSQGVLYRAEGGAPVHVYDRATSEEPAVKLS